MPEEYKVNQESEVLETERIILLCQMLYDENWELTFEFSNKEVIDDLGKQF